MKTPEPDRQEGNALDTRERVLEAAGEVFAERGFAKATIREIVERAGANLNAVNYYFRDKRGLYLAVFEYAYRVTENDDHAERLRMRTLPPAARLRAFIGHLMHGFVLRKTAPWHLRLVHREIREPTGVLDLVVKWLIRPRFDELVGIVRALLPADASDLRARLCAEHIVAQCMHPMHGWPIASQLIPELQYTPEGIDVLADHVAAFSLAALRHLPCEESHA